MKTMIFNGSARKNGDTQSLIEELVRQLEGETLIVDAHDVDVKACMDCRYCWEHSECCVKDDWQEIDAYIRDCDNIVIASPVYFCEITGPLLSLLSRLQVPGKDRDQAKERRYDSAGRRKGNRNCTAQYFGGTAASDECKRAV